MTINRTHSRTINRRHHNPRRIANALLIAALAGCSSAPNTTSTEPAQSSDRTVQQLLDKAHAAPIDARAPYLLDAAAQALQAKRTQSADAILRELAALKLTSAEHARRQLLAARVAMQQNKFEQALSALQDKQLLQTLDQLKTNEQIDVSLIRAQALYATGKYFASAQERVFVEPLLPEAQLEANHQEIRRALTNLSTADLQRYRDKNNSEPLRGWLDLALAAKQNRAASTATASLNRPTSTLSGDLVAFDSIATEAPKQVALLLPLSGKLAGFGEAVRDGFFAAHYEAQRRGERLSDVRVYDSDSAGIVQLYQQAVADGAGVVIGPLEKLQVAQFYSQTLPVPLLALNRADSTQPAPANLYQFSLAPEDETAQLADLIAQDNRHNVLVIVSDEESRSREAQAFLQRWQSNGGYVAGTALFHGQQDLSTAIRSALNIPRSEARGKEMESLLNRNVEYTPHRRRDIDAVFMLAKPTQARSIKPLLNFYYAGDLPVYSTSRIYSGYPGAFDRDLEKVRFTEMPWVLQPSELKQQILAAQPNARNYLRLYAMGIDSFSLYSRLHQFETLAGKRVAGQSGTLTLDGQRIVLRELLLAEMRNGAAVQKEFVSKEDDNARESTDVVPEKAAN